MFRVLKNHVMHLEEEIDRLDKILDKLDVSNAASMVTVLDTSNDAFGRIAVKTMEQAKQVVIDPLRKNIELLKETSSSSSGTDVATATGSASTAGDQQQSTATSATASQVIVVPKRVRLSNKTFTPEAAQAIGPFLESLENLREADFSDMIATLSKDDGMKVLGSICGSLIKHKATLRVLDLSDNALGENGVRALEPVLTQLSLLQEVRFKNNGLSALSLQLLLGHLAPARRSLRTIVFDNNNSGDGGAQALAGFLLQDGNGICPSLKELCMSSSRVRSEGGIALIKAIGESLPNLEKLDLRDSMIGANGAKMLADYFSNKRLQKLRVLCLSDAGLINDEEDENGLDYIASALMDPAVVPMLEVLDLSLLEVSKKQMKGSVGQMILAKKDTLRELILDENSDIGTVGAKKLAEIIVQCKYLTKLSVRECQFEDDAEDALKAAKDEISLSHEFALDLSDIE